MPRSLILTAALVAATLLSLVHPLHAATVSLSWDPDPEGGAAGYVVHYGTARGVYTVSVDVGTETSWRTSELPAGKRYYFAVRAYNETREMGEFSEELTADLRALRTPRRRNPRLADTDGNGTDDVTIYDPNFGLFGVADPFYRAVGNRFETWDEGLDVSTANFNADQRADYLLYDEARGTWAGALSQGDGSFRFVEGAWEPGGTAEAADFNGDGLDDLFFYQPDSGRWSAVIGESDGSMRSQDGLSGPARDVYVASLTAAGRSDVVLYDRTSGRWSAIMGGGTDGLRVVDGEWVPGLTVHRAKVAPGARDVLFLYNAENGEWQMATPAGDGTFSYQSGSWPAGHQIQFADLNRDKRDDAIAYDAASGSAMICLARGTGAFACRTSTWVAGASLSVGDLDGDGAADAFLYNSDTGAWMQVPGGKAGRSVSGQWQPGLTIVGRP